MSDSPATRPVSRSTPDRPDALDHLEKLGREGGGGEPARTWPTLITLVIVLVEAVVLGFAARSTGSAVLFATAAQSLAGAGVEVFLLFGTRRSRRPADPTHPLGHGREAFFWSLIASVGVFVGGGVVSIYYGITTFDRPESGEAYLLGYLVLGAIVVADVWTLHAAVRPLRDSVIVGRIGFWAGLRRTSDAGVRTLVFDNAASVLGGVIGIGGLAAHQLTGDPHADSVASLLIGLLLLVTTVALLQANRELLTDHTIDADVVTAMRERLLAQDGIVSVPDLVAVYSGPHSVLVTGTVALDRRLDVARVEQALADCGTALGDRWPGELRVYLSPVPDRAVAHEPGD